jgi:hypothetical protein
MTGVQPFERRWIHEVDDDGNTTGFEVLLLKPVSQGSTIWHALEAVKGAFVKVDLRRSGYVKKEAGKVDGVIYKVLAMPNDDEKAVIVAMLEDFLGQGTQAGSGLVSVAPRSPFRDEPGSYPMPRRAPRGRWNDRGRHMVRRAREAGPSQVIAGSAVSWGLLWKFYVHIATVWENIMLFFFAADGTKTKVLLRIEKFIGRSEELTTKFRDVVDWVETSGNWALENWDTILLLLAAAYLAYKIFFEAGDAAHQVRQQREEDAQRHGSLERLLSKQHSESLGEQRRLRDDLRRTGGDDGAGGGPGVGAMRTKLDDYRHLLTADKKGAGTATTGTMNAMLSKVTGTVSRLLKRAKSPLDRVCYLLTKIHAVEPWNMPLGFRSRLAAEFASCIHQDGQTGRQYARQYRRDHHLEGCTAFNAFDAICDISDAFHMDDDWDDLYSSHGYERLARWGYGLLQVMEEVEDKKHWDGDRKDRRTRWQLLERYHPTAANISEARSDEAEEEVTEGLKRDALFKKWLDKAGPGPGG